MRVNLIIPSFYPAIVYGGPIFSTYYVCKELSKFDDIEIFVSTTNANMGKKLDVPTNKFLKLENFFVKYYDETLVDKFSVSLIRYIRYDIKKADLVHVQAIFNTPIPVSLFWARYYKKPTVLSPRGSLSKWAMSNGNRLKNYWLKFFISPFANYVVWHATSLQEKEEILEYFPNARIEIIPNGIYIDKFQNKNSLSREEFLMKYAGIRCSKVDKIIVSMGRLQKKKGFDILVKSFARILDHYPKSYLIIAGPDEGEKEKLLLLIRELQIGGKAFIIDVLKGQDKIDFLANADLFVLPSHSENFGNVYLESLAAGTPIVASKNTPWEIVEKYGCGKWVNNDVDSVSQAMLTMLKYPKSLFKDKCIFLARKYDWKNIAKLFRELYRGITNG